MQRITQNEKQADFDDDDFSRRDSRIPQLECSLFLDIQSYFNLGMSFWSRLSLREKTIHSDSLLPSFLTVRKSPLGERYSLSSSGVTDTMTHDDSLGTCTHAERNSFLMVSL